MIGKRDADNAPALSVRGRDMTRQNVTDVQCEALFASALQGSDAVTADVGGGCHQRHHPAPRP